YEQVFGGELVLNTYGDFPGASPEHADRIMHAMLDTRSGYTIMGADSPPGGEYQTGTNITVSISGDDADELQGYCDQLSEGGTVTVPMEKQMWGDEFGACIDRFGIPWMVNIMQPQA